MKNLISEEKVNIINDLMAKFIINDYQPFNVVEDKYLKESFQELGYELPGRTFFKNFIKKDYDEKRVKFKEYLKKIDNKVSITFDLWTSPSNIPFLGIKIHYISKDWILHSETLDFVKFEYPHTAETISKSIQELLKEFDLLKKLLGITTDNASNMINFYELFYNDVKLINGSVIRFGCGSHIINLAVQDGLIAIETKIKFFREKVKLIKNSPKLLQEIKALCEANNVKFYSPILDVKTRWNSTYYMLENIQKMKKIYNLHKDIKINDNYWNFLESLLEYLKIYEEATKLLSNTLYPSISLMFIVIKKLFEETSKWKNKQTYTEINKSATYIFDKLSKYWSNLQVIGLISTYLDPRFKNEILKIFPIIKLKVKDLYDEYNKENDNNVELSNNNDNNINDSFLSFITVTEINNELEKYENLNVTKDMLLPKFDLLNWWKVNEYIYPTLSKIAKDFLSIQSSSVSSEQLFSSSKLVITDRRNKLNEDTIQYLMCLKSWNELFHKK
jgi:hypothetical protein